MKPNYIQAPLSFLEITPRKGKTSKIKPAKRNEVPEAYRKKRFKMPTAIISEILLHIIGLTDFIRKEIKTWINWSKISKLFKRG